MRVPLFSGIGILFLICALPAPAQMAQEKEFQHGYRFFQNSAPEFLQIEVIDVTADASRGLFGGSMTQVKASARVIDVIRSDSGTPNGQVIEIRYEHAPKAGNSAETPPILEKGKSYPAFLKRTGNIFVPVARHLSFSPPSGVQMKVYEEARTRSREKALLAANQPPSPPVNIPVVEPAPLPPSAKAAPKAEPVAPEPAPAAPKATPVNLPVIEPAPPAPSAKRTPKAEPVIPEPAPVAPKATPVAEPLPPAPPAPQPAVAESSPLETKAAEPALPASEPSQLVRDARKVRTSRATATKPQAELTPAAAESGPLPTNTPPAPVIAETPKDTPPAPAPAPAKPSPAPPTATTKKKTSTPPASPAPQITRTPAPKPKEEPLPTIPIEAPAAAPMEPAQKPVPQPSTEGAEARKGYAEIYGMIKEGETVQNEGKNDKAREIYTQAREKLLTLKSEQPEFQPFMVQYRIRDLEKKLEALSAATPAKPPGSPAK